MSTLNELIPLYIERRQQMQKNCEFQRRKSIQKKARKNWKTYLKSSFQSEWKKFLLVKEITHDKYKFVACLVERRCFVATIDSVYVNPIQDGGIKKAPPLYQFYNYYQFVTITNAGLSSHKCLTFSFNPFATLV